MTMPINWLRLPEFCYAERALGEVRGIVVHYVSAIDVDPPHRFSPRAVQALMRDLNRPAARRTHYRFDAAERLYGSYHFLIGRRGGVYTMVPLPHVAYHAGVSEMHGRSGCNEFCLGISLIATHDSGFTDAQYEALIALTRELMADHRIDPAWIRGHDEVARPSGRKSDPGPAFDWPRYRRAL